MDPKELNFQLAHLGINQADAAEGAATAALLASLFGWEQRDTEGSIFVNEQFEVMKKPFRGRLGHIGITTSDVVKARAWLESKGIVFAEESANYDENGRLKLIYARDDIAGFAFHITQKG